VGLVFNFSWLYKQAVEKRKEKEKKEETERRVKNRES
jgi:hypothetical protein